MAVEPYPRIKIVASATSTTDANNATITPASVPGLSVTWTADPTHLYLTMAWIAVTTVSATATYPLISLTAPTTIANSGVYPADTNGTRYGIHLMKLQTGLSGTQTRGVNFGQPYPGTVGVRNSSSPGSIAVWDLGPA